MLDIKKIAEGAIAALIAGLLLYLLVESFLRDSNPSNHVTAETNWVEIDNFLNFSKTEKQITKNLDYEESIKRADEIENAVAILNLTKISAMSNFRNSIIIGNLKLNNESDVRIQNVDVIVEDGLLIDSISTNGKYIKDKTSIAMIEPGEVINLTYFSTDILYKKLPISVIQNDELVYIQNNKLISTISFYKFIVSEYELGVLISLILSFVTILIILLAAALELFVGNKIAFETRFTSKNKLEKYFQILKHSKSHYPEKTPKDFTLTED